MNIVDAGVRAVSDILEKSMSPRPNPPCAVFLAGEPEYPIELFTEDFE
jgi:hypothetical protein